MAFYAFESALGPWGGRVALPCARRCSPWPPWWPGAAGAGRGCFTSPAAGGGPLCPGGGGRPLALGCLLPLGTVFQLGDACNGLMALPNVAALFLCGERRRGSAAGAERGLPREARKKSLGEDSIKF